MIRVLNVLFDDRYGGPQKRVVEVGRRLAGRVETILCLPDRGGNTAAIASQAGLPVRRVAVGPIPRISNPFRVVRWLLHLPGDTLRYARMYRRERPHVVHVSGAFFLPPALACGLTRTPLVWQLNDVSTPRTLAYPLGAIVRLLATRVVVSASAAARHYGVAGAAPEVFYPPVDASALAVLKPPASRGPQTHYRVGLMANWNPDKGVEYFIRALALVRHELGDRLEVIFAGGQYDTQTAYCARMEALIDELGMRPAVRHLGFVRDVRKVLAQIDVLVSSSVAEVFGMSVVEAMAAGIPVVVTSAGGSAEAVHADPERPAGIIVPSRNPRALADAIVSLWRDPVTAGRFGRNGRLVAAKRFDVEACAAAHWRVYTDLAPAALPSVVP